MITVVRWEDVVVRFRGAMPQSSAQDEDATEREKEEKIDRDDEETLRRAREMDEFKDGER